MIKISTDKSLLDINYIFTFLNKSYWATNRSLDEVKKSIDNSLCFGMYKDGTQIGFARIVTDQVVFSYLMDVFIDKKQQQKQFGKQLLEYIYNHPKLINVEKNYLHTKDAQSFYNKFGFDIYPYQNRMMIKLNK